MPSKKRAKKSAEPVEKSNAGRSRAKLLPSGQSPEAVLARRLYHERMRRNITNQRDVVARSQAIHKTPLTISEVMALEGGKDVRLSVICRCFEAIGMNPVDAIRDAVMPKGSEDEEG